MTPDKLASYARVLFTYLAASAAAAGAGYEMIIGHFDSPIVGLALALVGAITGYHLSGTSSTPAEPVPVVPVAPVVPTVAVDPTPLHTDV